MDGVTAVAAVKGELRRVSCHRSTLAALPYREGGKGGEFETWNFSSRVCTQEVFSFPRPHLALFVFKGPSLFENCINTLNIFKTQEIFIFSTLP